MLQRHATPKHSRLESESSRVPDRSCQLRALGAIAPCFHDPVAAGMRANACKRTCTFLPPKRTRRRLICTTKTYTVDPTPLMASCCRCYTWMRVGKYRQGMPARSSLRCGRHARVASGFSCDTSGLRHSDSWPHHGRRKCVRWRSDDDRRHCRVRDFSFARRSFKCHVIYRYWFDRQSNRHRILIEEDPDFGGEAPATHASTSSLFAAISSGRKPHGVQAPPGSPRACD